MLTEPPEASILSFSAQFSSGGSWRLLYKLAFCWVLLFSGWKPESGASQKIGIWGLSNAGVAGTEHTKKQNPVDSAIPNRSGASLAGPEPTYSAQQRSSRPRFVGSIAHEWHKLLILRHYPFFLFASPKAPFPFRFFSLSNTCVTNCHN